MVVFAKFGMTWIVMKFGLAILGFGDHKAADVVMGVAALSPDYLIEVDANGGR